MPNWCENRMTISHPDKAMVMEVVAAATKTGLFHYFYPMPDELRGTSAKLVETLSDEQKDLVAKYGAKDWYDWALKSWGTKWDVTDAYAGDVFFNEETQEFSVDISYETAWSPGVEALEKAVDKGFTIENFYIEPAVGFCGVWEGDPTAGYNDTCINFADADLDTEENIEKFMEEEVPSVLQDKFFLRERFLGNLDFLREDAM